MIWYIVTFVVGVAVGVAGLMFVLPRVESLWNRMNRYAARVKRFNW